MRHVGLRPGVFSCRPQRLEGSCSQDRAILKWKKFFFATSAILTLLSQWQLVYWVVEGLVVAIAAAEFGDVIGPQPAHPPGVCRGDRRAETPLVGACEQQVSPSRKIADAPSTAAQWSDREQ